MMFAVGCHQDLSDSTIIVPYQEVHYEVRQIFNCATT